MVIAKNVPTLTYRDVKVPDENKDSIKDISRALSLLCWHRRRQVAGAVSTFYTLIASLRRLAVSMYSPVLSDATTVAQIYRRK